LWVVLLVAAPSMVLFWWGLFLLTWWCSNFVCFRLGWVGLPMVNGTLVFLVANFWCCVGSFGFGVLPAVVDFVWISR
jgi:hypothetical protein